jgi:hypothetical protein
MPKNRPDGKGIKRTKTTKKGRLFLDKTYITPYNWNQYKMVGG